MKHSSPVVRYCIVFLAAGCSDAPAVTAFVVEDSAGVEIAINAAPLHAASPLWHVADEPALSIGLAEGAREYVFDRIHDAIRLPDGAIVVTDARRQLRFYDASGRHLRSAGGHGRGPGDFESAADLVLTGDTILAFDRDLGRISAYDTAGSYLGSTLLERSRGTLRLHRLLGHDVDGSVVLVPSSHSGVAFSSRPSIIWHSAPVLRLPPDAASVDTVGEPMGLDALTDSRSWGSAFLGRRSSAASDGGLLYVTDGGRYEVRVYSTTSGLRRIIRLVRVPRRVTPDATEAARRKYVEGTADPHWRAQRTRLFDESPKPESLPWIAQVQLDPAGHLWVGEYAAGEQPRNWSVFDPTGRWLGSLGIPANLRVLRIGVDYILGVRSDELGVERLQLYEIPRI